MASKNAAVAAAMGVLCLSACGISSGSGDDGSATGAPLPPPPTSSRPAPSNKPPADNPGPPMEEVDAAGFKTSQGYFFVSRDKDVFCAISTDPAMAEMKVGCQGTFTVPQLAKCKDPASSAPAAWFPADAGKPVVTDCVNQGFFVGEEPKVLEPGKMIRVDGVTCGALMGWEDNTAPIFCEQGDRRFTLRKGSLKVK